MKVDICCIKRAFYKAINGILSYCKTADEFVKRGLVKAYCLPLLTYCIGAIDLPASSVKDLAQGRIQEFTKGEAVTAVDESPPQVEKFFSPPHYCM